MDEDDTSPLGGVIDSVQHTAGRSLTDYRCSCRDLRRVVLALLSILAVPASVSVSCVHSTARWDRGRHGGAPGLAWTCSARVGVRILRAFYGPHTIRWYTTS